MRHFFVSFILMNVKSWLLVLITALFSLTSYWMLEVIRSQTNQETLVLRTRPDYYAENVHLIQILPNKQKQYRIVGQKMTHYPDDDRIEIIHPIVSQFNPPKPLMTIEAQRSTIKKSSSQTEDAIYFYDNVILHYPQTPTSSALTLYTAYLVAYPNTNILETDKPIKIVSDNSITEGVGIKANADTQYIQILKQVQSTIQPHAFSH